jgi:muramoyltetrapeptide carboxypeptidase
VENTIAIKPQALQFGDRIGVVAPAGSVDLERLEVGVKALRGAGFNVELAAGLTEKKGYLAGSEESRAWALEQFFVRRDIRAVFCARGGFGSVQLLPLLDADLVQRHPKIFVGYSDVTILLNWLRQKCGLVTFHGPMVAMEVAAGMTGRTWDFFWGTLLGEKACWEIKVPQVIRGGVAKGEIAGGCLSLIVTTLATPYEIDTKGKILFLEDIGEKPYRIERMLTHLKMAGKFNEIRGLVFGNFSQCEGEGTREVPDIVAELFCDAPYPVVVGFPAGHGVENVLLPFGTTMALDGHAGTVSLLESPVTIEGPA